MADPIYDELNLTTKKEIYPRVIKDNFFLDTPFLAYLRAKSLVPFAGGTEMQSTFLYAPLLGGMYQKGGPGFNLAKPQTLAGTTFQPKYYQVNVTEYLEDIEVENKGPEAVFSLIDVDLRNAMTTMTEGIALVMQKHGQSVVTGVASSRNGHINGWPEALNDGKTAGWDGNYYTTYGGATRNGVVGAAINSEPYWCGNQDGTSGPITFAILEETYQSCAIGRKAPDLGVGNKAVLSYIKERMQPQQRFAQERDPVFGVSGFKFNDAMILKDDLFPSKRYGVSSRAFGESSTVSNFTSPATVGANSNMPTSTSCDPGEVFVWLNTSTWAMRISDSPRFGFGFTGFKPQIDGTRVAGQILAALNLQCFEPRLNKQLLGIGA
jgi:hypothetical protein